MAKISKKKFNTNTNKENEAKAFLTIIRLLKSVDLNSSEAKLNKYSISDHKGGRILL